MSSTTTPSKPETPQEFIKRTTGIIDDTHPDDRAMVVFTLLLTEIIALHERINKLVRDQYVPPDTSGRYA